MRRDLRTRLAVLSILLLLATVLVPAQSSPPGLISNLESYLESLRVQAGIPGMSAAVVQDGEIVWEHGFGFQNVAARVRATPDTPYLVGDLSATLAAVLLLQCVEEKRMTLDDPITKYVSYPEPGVTLRQALSHTSTGSFVYSPERFAQLGPVLEYCVPQPYAKTVAHRLLDRLAMRDSVPGTNLGVPDPKLPDDEFEQADLDRYRGVVERMAVPYRVEGRGRVQQTDIPIDGIGATSGLVSTVRDLARLEKGIDSGLLLRDETLQQAWSPVAAGDGGAAPMGLGWFVQPHRAGRVVWHFGLVANAYSSLVVKLPDRHLAFILLANSSGLSAPFQLGSGDVTRSLFATLFLRLAS
jgi:CubicO group peptidase (beta-lactamase class C family)